MSIAYIYHPDCALHAMGPRHPERPERLAAIEAQLDESGLRSDLDIHEALAVEDAQLRAVHDVAYLDQVAAASPDEGLVQLDPDTAMNPHSLRAAQRAAGAAVQAVNLVLGGEADRAFCAVRPPGHHAERDRAMGFCIYNNIAVGAFHAINSHGLERVAIVDFDVHHGNGTENIVAGDKRILFCSTFQHPFYPNSGDQGSAANVINTPLTEGTDGDGFRAAVSTHWLPALEAFRPQLILVSAGFDAHRDDRMAGLELDETDYVWVTQALRDIAERHCAGKMISCLEGGYDLGSLGRSAAAHLGVYLAP